MCGAGAAGLSSAAMLKARGVDVTVLERSDRIASSWRSRYEGLRLNTLGWMSTQPGYHVGRRPRGFPSRDEWVGYLERYAEHHRLPIQFETEVEQIERRDGGWQVQTSRGPLAARSLIVATGFDHDPLIPEWPGLETFTGELIHAADFRNAIPYRDRDVLVVGPGVTGSELASFLVDGGARRVRVATRTPPNILTRTWLGLPLNPAALILDRLPARAGDRLTWLTQRMIFGDLSAYGLSRPPMGVVSNLRQRHVGPVIDDGFVNAVKGGRIEIVAAVEAFEGADVLLADGQRIQPDGVIAATGYRRGLERLVGHLGVLGVGGHAAINGSETHTAAPNLFFIGFRARLSGQLRLIRLDAKRLARAVSKAKRRNPASGDTEAA